MTLLNGWTVGSKSLGGELILVLRLVAALVAVDLLAADPVGAGRGQPCLTTGREGRRTALPPQPPFPLLPSGSLPRSESYDTASGKEQAHNPPLNYVFCSLGTLMIPKLFGQMDENYRKREGKN